MLDDTPAAEPSRHTAEPSRQSAEQDRGPGTRRKVLFLCTGNSCRSQMAEGWARKLSPDAIEVYSAGVKPTALNVEAVRVMAEAGIDISRQCPKHLDELAGVALDYVVTVCDDARESCPVFPGKAKVIHRSFDDPPRLAKGAASEADRLAPYRRVRDEIREFVQSLPDLLAHMEEGHVGSC
jgi:arsenate reductase (thioredoxin)